MNKFCPEEEKAISNFLASSRNSPVWSLGTQTIFIVHISSEMNWLNHKEDFLWSHRIIWIQSDPGLSCQSPECLVCVCFRVYRLQWPASSQRHPGPAVHHAVREASSLPGKQSGSFSNDHGKIHRGHDGGGFSETHSSISNSSTRQTKETVRRVC